jgi:hypothetical protein
LCNHWTYEDKYNDYTTEYECVLQIYKSNDYTTEYECVLQLYKYNDYTTEYECVLQLYSCVIIGLMKL